MFQPIPVCNIHLENLNTTYTVVKKHDRITRRVNTFVTDVKKSDGTLPCLDVKWKRNETDRMFDVTITPRQTCDAVPPVVLRTYDYFTISFQHNATIKLGRKKHINTNSKFFAPIVRVNCIPAYTPTFCPGITRRVVAMSQRSLFDTMLHQWAPTHVHVTRIRHSLWLHSKEDRQLRIPFFEDKDYIHQLPERNVTGLEFNELLKGNMKAQEEFFLRRLEEQEFYKDDTEDDAVSLDDFLFVLALTSFQDCYIETAPSPPVSDNSSLIQEAQRFVEQSFANRASLKRKNVITID